MQQYIDLAATQYLLTESSQAVKDEVTVVNRFTTKPQAIIITDTYNNPFFQIRPAPIIDSAKLDLRIVYKRYRELYGTFDITFLPWHFCLEFVNDRYYVFNTRPLMLKFPLDNNAALKQQKEFSIKWDNTTSKFIKKKQYNLAECIHIAIVGNSNKDVYTNKLYHLINVFCIQPILLQYKLPQGLYQSIWPLNLGKKFNIHSVVKFQK